MCLHGAEQDAKLVAVAAAERVAAGRAPVRVAERGAEPDAVGSSVRIADFPPMPESSGDAISRNYAPSALPRAPRGHDQLVWVQAKTTAQCVELMNHKLRAVEKWVNKWRLPLNLDKCQQIVFSPQPQPHPAHHAQLWIRRNTSTGMRLRGREVLEVNPSTAAYKAGIRRGMHIVKLNGHDVLGAEGKQLWTGIAAGAHAKSGTVQIEFECPPDVRLFERQVVYAPVVKYLGVLYQENHKFTEHVQTRLREFKRRRGVLQYLSGTTWGCRRATLRQVYQGYVRAYVEYASPAWWPYITMELIRKLEVEQNHAARTITGCMPRTRIAVLLTEAGLRPLELRADAAALIARERYRRLPDGVPARSSAETMRLSTRAEEFWAKAGLDKAPREPLPKAGAVPSWNCDCNVDFHPITVTP
eukprot:gene1940-biopygen5525